MTTTTTTALTEADEDYCPPTLDSIRQEGERIRAMFAERGMAGNLYDDCEGGVDITLYVNEPDKASGLVNVGDDGVVSFAAIRDHNHRDGIKGRFTDAAVDVERIIRWMKQEA